MSHVQAYCRLYQQLDSSSESGDEMLHNQMDFHWKNLSESELDEVHQVLNRRDVMTTVTSKPGKFGNNAMFSNYGYHPCDYTTFRKLKQLHKRYWETVYAVGRWVRWDRKTVHQHGPEPEYCPIFVEEQGEWRPCTHKNGDETFKGMKYYPKTLNDHGVIEAYQQARMPVENADDVKPLKLSVEQIDRLCERLYLYDNEVED